MQRHKHTCAHVNFTTPSDSLFMRSAAWPHLSAFCGPHTCSPAHIRGLQMTMASPSSRPTAHLLASLKIYFPPRCTPFACHVLLRSACLMRPETSDLVPRNNRPCSEAHSMTYEFSLSFFVCYLKCRKMRPDVLCFFMLVFISALRLDPTRYCTCTYILYSPPPCRAWTPKTLLRHLRLRGDSGQM